MSTTWPRPARGAGTVTVNGSGRDPRSGATTGRSGRGGGQSGSRSLDGDGSIRPHPLPTERPVERIGSGAGRRAARRDAARSRVTLDRDLAAHARCREHEAVDRDRAVRTQGARRHGDMLRRTANPVGLRAGHRAGAGRAEAPISSRHAVGSARGRRVPDRRRLGRSRLDRWCRVGGRLGLDQGRRFGHRRRSRSRGVGQRESLASGVGSTPGIRVGDGLGVGVGTGAVCWRHRYSRGVRPLAWIFDGHRTADVSEMPRFVGVTGDGGLALRVGHHEAVAPGVVAQPGAGLTPTPVRIVPRRGSAVALEVERRPH